MKPKSEQIARETASEIHWHHVKKPDVYGQEEAAQTTKIILKAFEKLNPLKKPLRIL